MYVFYTLLNLAFLYPKFVGVCFKSKCSKNTKVGKMSARLLESAWLPLQVHDRDNEPEFVLFEPLSIKQTPTNIGHKNSKFRRV